MLPRAESSGAGRGRGAGVGGPAVSSRRARRVVQVGHKNTSDYCWEDLDMRRGGRASTSCLLSSHMLTFALLRTRRLLLSDVLACLCGNECSPTIPGFCRDCFERERTSESTLEESAALCTRVRSRPSEASGVRCPCGDRLPPVRPARSSSPKEATESREPHAASCALAGGGEGRNGSARERH